MFRKDYQAAYKDVSPRAALLEETLAKAAGMAAARRRSPLLGRLLAAGMAAAVFALSVWGGGLLQGTKGTDAPSRGNAFTLTAYAMDEGEDGTITPKNITLSQSEPDNGEQSTFLIAIRESLATGEGTYYCRAFVPLGFCYEGENVARVEFSIDEGEFMRYNEQEGFCALGSRYTIDTPVNGEPSDMIYWACEVGSIDTDSGAVQVSALPNAIITARVTFTDGTVQEDTMSYDRTQRSLVKVVAG